MVCGLWFVVLPVQPADKSQASRMNQKQKTINYKLFMVYGLWFFPFNLLIKVRLPELQSNDKQQTTNNKQQTTNHLNSFHMLRQAPL
jgi:hypothetical protein